MLYMSLRIILLRNIFMGIRAPNEGLSEFDKLLLDFMHFLPLVVLILLIFIIYRWIKKKKTHWIIYLITFLIFLYIILNYQIFLCGLYYFPGIYERYCPIF